jgi:enoyl-CoA hydratase/carnithine racemase
LGFHHGFGLTVTLPALVGQQRALEILYTGARVSGEQGVRLGLCDRLVEDQRLHGAAHEFAAEIAASAPLAVRSIRATMREGLVERFHRATARELQEQERLRRTEDFREGTVAARERRTPIFTGA